MLSDSRALRPTKQPMRNLILAALLAAPLSADLAAADAGRPTFINSHLSSTKIALNEPVRVEFTTLPREIEHIDITSAVANALCLGAGASWRLLGAPLISEQSVGSSAAVDPAKPVRERPKPITVVFTLLPRKPGDLQLPDVPMTWLQGNQVAHFGIVTVDPSIKVGGAEQDLPKEASGVVGLPWNTKFTEVKDHFPADQIENAKDRTLVHIMKTFTLEFVGGGLAQSTLVIPGRTIEQMRLEFLKRWGVPQTETPEALTWIIGWTCITVAANADNSGLTMTVGREDIQAAMDHTHAVTEVFDVLEAPVQETKEQADSRKTKEIQQELDRPAVPAR